MFDPPFLFEPTLTFWESKIAGWMSCRIPIIKKMFCDKSMD